MQKYWINSWHCVWLGVTQHQMQVKKKKLLIDFLFPSEIKLTKKPLKLLSGSLPQFWAAHYYVNSCLYNLFGLKKQIQDKIPQNALKWAALKVLNVLRAALLSAYQIYQSDNKEGVRRQMDLWCRIVFSLLKTHIHMFCKTHFLKRVSLITHCGHLTCCCFSDCHHQVEAYTREKTKTPLPLILQEPTQLRNIPHFFKTYIAKIVQAFNTKAQLCYHLEQGCATWCNRASCGSLAYKKDGKNAKK